MVVRAYAVCIGVKPECRWMESEMVGDGQGRADEADEAYHDNQYLFMSSPFRCQFALATVWFFLNLTFSISWIFRVMWFVVSFAWVTSSSLFVLTFCSSLVLQFMSFLIVEFILPAFIFSRQFAIALVFSMNVFRVFCGFISM